MPKKWQTKSQPKKEKNKIMTNKEKILDLYYNQHLKQNEIAKIIGTSKQYISKVVKEDVRNDKEKESRKQSNKEKRKVYLKEYFKTYDRHRQQDNSYQQLLAQQARDSFELSYHNNSISDYDYSRWNSSAYHNNKKRNLVLDSSLNVGFCIPKTINMNIKVPTQKYKHRNCFSR